MRRWRRRVVTMIATLVVVALAGGTGAYGVQGPPPGSPEGAVETDGGMTLRWTTEAAARNGPAPISNPVTACALTAPNACCTWAKLMVSLP